MTIVHAASRTNQLARYLEIRRTTEQLCRPLAIEDHVVQAMADVSPTKWHLAHVSWFFETFLLTPHLPGYEPLDPAYRFLFNSYYNGVGPQFSRPARGHLSRPTVAEVYAYRAWVDRGMDALLARDDIERGGRRAPTLIELGLQPRAAAPGADPHRHQVQPRREPAAAGVPRDRRARGARDAPLLGWRELRAAGCVPIGHDGAGFAFDNEGPRHTRLSRPFRLADRLVTNGEYLEFIDAGGYRTPAPWLSEGWRTVQEQRMAGAALLGAARRRMVDADARAASCPLDPHAPGLPRELLRGRRLRALARGAAADRAGVGARGRGRARSRGNFQDARHLPSPAGRPPTTALAQLFGDVWEWTQSAYAPYPGYRPAPGAVGEYNGKFMVNQLVLRGGSCVTPQSHIRASYRNFFPPDARWQFSGIRLAEDA